jgi:hypothetical protein
MFEPNATAGDWLAFALALPLLILIAPAVIAACFVLWMFDAAGMTAGGRF